MLNKADYIESISEYDRQKLEEYILNEQLIAACQVELESQEALLQAEKDALLEEQEASLERVSTSFNCLRIAFLALSPALRAL